MKRTKARFTLTTAAAPKPCNTRAEARIGNVQDRAQRIEALVNTTSPPR